MYTSPGGGEETASSGADKPDRTLDGKMAELSKSMEQRIQMESTVTDRQLTANCHNSAHQEFEVEAQRQTQQRGFQAPILS